MTRYYVIPLVENLVLLSYHNEKYIPISEYVHKYFPAMSELEEERISIICSGDYESPLTKKQLLQLKNNEKKKIKMAEELGIPLNLLVEENDGKIYEIVTQKEIIGKDHNPAFLATREESKNIFLTYYNQDYIVKVKEFMRKSDLDNSNFQVIQGGLQKVIKR